MTLSTFKSHTYFECWVLIVQGDTMKCQKLLFQKICSMYCTQSHFGKVYSVKGQNMNKLDCPSFPMVCGPKFLWSGPPGAKKNFCPWTKGGTSVKSFFHCGPPCDSKFENFCSSWRSRPLEHESTHHMEA